MPWNEEKPTDDRIDAIKTAIETAAVITITPLTLEVANDHVHAGYYAETTLHAVDADLAVGNIKHGVTVFGFTGTYDTEAVAPIAAGTVLNGKKGRVNGATITGTMPDNDGDVAAISYHRDGTSIHVVPAKGFTDGIADAVVITDADFVTGNIKAGINLFGLAGKVEVVDTTTGDAVAANILTGKKAWVDGVEITGNVAAGANINGAEGTLVVTITDGLYSGSKTVTPVDGDLVTGNIRATKTIFGVAGKAEVVDTTEGAGGAIAAEIATGKFAWVNGVRIEGTHV